MPSSNANSKEAQVAGEVVTGGETPPTWGISLSEHCPHLLSPNDSPRTNVWAPTFVPYQSIFKTAAREVLKL